jgi:uncharacterized ferritin-like protein (DUF455 family)
LSPDRRSFSAVLAFCQRILESGDLETKLAPYRGSASNRMGTQSARGAVLRMRPARDPVIAMQGNIEPLPRPRQLVDPAARALCLARFAHHELMAVEMFAWALMRWPELPGAMQRGLLGVLGEEQLHCRLYLERLAAHGSQLCDHVLSDYFWKHAEAISSSPAGPAAFLAAMGLTFEQGNLDFAPLYRDAFREAGDEESARVCERVHRDEIRHVRFAHTALRTLAGDSAASDVELYERAVPFPLSAARAKGRRFDAAARREAGLAADFVEYVRTARPSPEARPRRKGS